MNKAVAKVGIILLTYNQGKFLHSAISALKAQTFQDFAVYLVDDASDDGKTPAIISKLNYNKIARKDLYKVNKGVASRARAMYRSLTNQYILIYCADDFLAPTFLEKTVKYLDSHPSCGAVSTNVRLFTKSPDDFYFEQKYNPKKMTLAHLLAQNHVLGSSLMNGDVLRKIDLSGGFVRYQDWDRWITMAEAGYQIGLIAEPLFYYRQHPKSLSHQAKLEDELNIRKLLLKKHQAAYKKNIETVIMDLSSSIFEISRGKEWLEQQTASQEKGIAELRQVISEQRAELDALKASLSREQKYSLLRPYRKLRKALANEK